MYKISVVICTYNRFKLLTGTLESLVNQSLDRSLYEIVIVNNASTDNTRETVMDYIGKYSDWNLRYVYEPDQGLSNARNAGYKNAKARYVAYIDDDAKANKDWLEKILKIIKTVEPDIFGGQIFPVYEKEKPKWFLDRYEISTNGNEARFLNDEEYISGSNIVFKKQILEQLGGFDPTIGVIKNKLRVGEETKLILETRKKIGNNKVYYDPGMVVHHLIPERKMCLKHFIKRSITGGWYASRIWETKVTLCTRVNSAIVLVKTLSTLLYELTIGLIFRNETRYRYNQNYIIEVICPRISTLVELFYLLAVGR